MKLKTIVLFFLIVVGFSFVHSIKENDDGDQNILDRINVGGRCYHADNMHFYPIRNTLLVDADSVVFDFKGSTNYSMICCMFSGTRFITTHDRKVDCLHSAQSLATNIQLQRGVRCCKFKHKLSFHSGSNTYIVKDFDETSSDVWKTDTSMTALITSQQVRDASSVGVGYPMTVVYDAYFQLYYPTKFAHIISPIEAPTKPGKGHIHRSWRMVRGLPDVHILTKTTTMVPGAVIICSVYNASTPRIRLYPSLQPNVFRGKCNFHTMRIRSHEPLASKLPNSRATYPHFSLPQLTTYVTAKTWSTFPKCAFQLGAVGMTTVTAKCRTSVAGSMAQTDGWSANSLRLTLYNPKITVKNRKATYYFTDEVELGFAFQETSKAPYDLLINFPGKSKSALYLVPKSKSKFTFYGSATAGVYEVEIKVIPKVKYFDGFEDESLFKDTIKFKLEAMRISVVPSSNVHYIFEIVRCKSGVKDGDNHVAVKWDFSEESPYIRSKINLQQNGTEFVILDSVKDGTQIVAYCTVTSRNGEIQRLRHNFTVGGEPHLRLEPQMSVYYGHDFVKCEAGRESVGKVILKPLDLCKDEGSWCHRNINKKLQSRKKLDTFAFPHYLKEAKYNLECILEPINSTRKFTTKLFTIDYKGVHMRLSPNKIRHEFLTEIKCVLAKEDGSLYFDFPTEWSPFVKVTGAATFLVTDTPNPGWMTFFCGLTDFKQKVGKNFTIYIGDERFGRPDTRNEHRPRGGRWEFYAIGFVAGTLFNIIILYVAFVLNFLSKISKAKKQCVRQFMEKYNIAEYEDNKPRYFSDLLSFSCDKDWINLSPPERHYRTTN